MAKKTRPPVKQIDDVLMPAKYIGSVDAFFTAIQGRIVREAYFIAYARKSGPNAGYVTAEDLAQAAQRVLPTAPADLVKKLTSNESNHARRKIA